MFWPEAKISMGPFGSKGGGQNCTLPFTCTMKHRSQKKIVQSTRYSKPQHSPSPLSRRAAWKTAAQQVTNPPKPAHPSVEGELGSLWVRTQPRSGSEMPLQTQTSRITFPKNDVLKSGENRWLKFLKPHLYGQFIN